MTRSATDTLEDLIGLHVETLQMMAEAQVVMTLRVLAMSGLWPVAEPEGQRMVSEKLPAFVEAGSAAMRAVMGGEAPQGVAHAWLHPIAREIRANSRRLTRAPG